MAPPAVSDRLIKGFYRQRKKQAGVVKRNKPPPLQKRSNKNAAKPKQRAAVQQQRAAADVVVAEELESELGRFDMDLAYGPCIGITRLRRWERAAAMGLSPPPRLRDLIVLQQQPRDNAWPDKNSSVKAVNGDSSSSISLQCIWAGKV